MSVLRTQLNGVLRRPGRLLMTGLSAVPFDALDGPVDERTLGVAADRAVLSRYALDLEVATR